MQKQANSNSCFVCGRDNPFGLHLKFYETAPGEVGVDFVAPDHYQGYPGVLHGGVVAAILDETAGRAHMGGFPPRFMFTAKLALRYRKNVPTGKPLKIVGKAGRSKGRIAEAWAGIYDAAGTLLAEADGLYMDLPEPPDPAQLESFGWKVETEE